MIPIPSRNADEAWFTTYMLSVLRAQGLRALHIREAETPGVLDLLVWNGSEILGWIELKIGSKPLEPGQREFIRNNEPLSGNMFVFRLRKNERFIECYQGLEEDSFAQIYEPMACLWRKWLWDHKRDASRYR